LQKKHALQKKFVAVIGYPKSGKSTIIQSLSGCNNHSSHGPVMDTSVNLSVYVHTASPQENPRTTEAVFKEILRDVKKDPNSQGLVIAIQPTIRGKRLRMERMFELAKQDGFESYAFILEHPYLGERIGNFDNIESRVLTSDPDAKVFALDGRRFAILNAEAIKSLSRFPY
jgi:energy-coupling factor transporter ATP-binding protein EcfA2